MIQYDLLATVAALGGALFGMERLASWRLKKRERRRHEAVNNTPPPVSPGALILDDDVRHQRRLSGTQILARTFLLLGLLATPAALHAQSSKIFVASFGNDANDGSRGSPKRNFQAAHDAVAANGEIVALDTAGYGRLIINKSVSVIVPPGVNGFVTTTGSSSAIEINTKSASDIVVLRGLIVEGSGSGTGANGIRVISQPIRHLSIEECTVRNFTNGISFLPLGDSKLSVYGSTIRSCGAALDINAGAGGAVTVTALIAGCRLDTNNVGIFTQPLNSAKTEIVATDCAIVGNDFGVLSNTLGGTVRVSNCAITGNNAGVRGVNGGQVLSRGNNTVETNPNGASFSATFSAK